MLTAAARRANGPLGRNASLAGDAFAHSDLIRAEHEPHRYGARKPCTWPSKACQAEGLDRWVGVQLQPLGDPKKLVLVDQCRSSQLSDTKSRLMRNLDREVREGWEAHEAALIITCLAGLRCDHGDNCSKVSRPQPP
jgi:hypothetical protein